MAQQSKLVDCFLILEIDQNLALHGGGGNIEAILFPYNSFLEREVTSLDLKTGELNSEDKKQDIEFLSLNKEKTLWLKVTYNESNKRPITEITYTLSSPKVIDLFPNIFTILRKKNQLKLCISIQNKGRKQRRINQ